MLKLTVLLVWLLGLLFLCYKLSPRILLTPQFVFVGGFVPSVTVAMLYAQTWELDLHIGTFLTLLGGTTLFVLVSALSARAFGRLGAGHGLVRESDELAGGDQKRPPAEVRSWKLAVVAAFQVAVLLWTVLTLNSTVAGPSFAARLENYRRLTLLSLTSPLPKLLLYARTFCVFAGYVFEYMLLKALIRRCPWNKAWLLVNILLSIVNSITLGGRGAAIWLILAAIAQAYFIYGRSRGWKWKPSWKVLLCGAGIVAAMAVLFQAFGTLLRGVGGTMGFMDYLSVYLSAEIKNLDIFIRNGKFGADISDWQTLVYVSKFLGRVLGHPEWIHGLTAPHNAVNGTWIGNVYTTFYAFLYDGGYWGVVLFTSLMAVISQGLFQYAALHEREYSIDFSVIVYSYAYSAIGFSFFSNFFYERLFTMSFVAILLCWAALWFFLVKFRFDFWNIRWK